MSRPPAVGTCRFGHKALGQVYGGGILSFYPHTATESPAPSPAITGKAWCLDAGGPISQRQPVQGLLAVEVPK